MRLIANAALKTMATVLVTGLLACGGDSTSPDSRAASMTAVTPLSISGSAGTAVDTRPSVSLLDQNGDPVAGATVRFSPSTGSTVSTPTVTTDANGVATVGAWTLGQSVGQYTLVASSASLPPVAFVATAAAGAPASLTKVAAGDNQTTRAGFVLAISPTVIVKDQYGNPVSGATVTFAVASGGGAIAGATQQTGPNGAATVGGWQLGDTPGTNTLTASSGALTPVVFTAIGTPNPACSVSTLTLGTPSSGALTTTDCNDEFSAYVDLYNITLPSSGIYVFGESSTTFDTFVTLTTPDKTPIGFDDDSPGSTNSSLKVVLPAGDYQLAASSYYSQETGAYTLVAAPSTQPITGCENVWLVRGVSTDQSLQSTDCTTNQFYSDDYFIFVKAGQTITVSMTPTAFDAVLQLYDAFTGNLLSTDDNPATNTAQLTYTAPDDHYYIISATSKVSLTTGAYTITVQ